MRRNRKRINPVWRFFLGVSLFLTLVVVRPPFLSLAQSSGSTASQAKSPPPAKSTSPFPQSQGSAADLRPLPAPPPSDTPTPSSSSQPPSTSAPPPPPNSNSQAPSPDPSTTEAEKKAKTAAEAQARWEKLAQADRLYLSGRMAEAEALYRQVKPPFPNEAKTVPLAEPILDPALLPPAGQVYWREAEAGLNSKLYSAVSVPLELLVEQYPQFIPAYLRLAAFREQEGQEKEALALLERAAATYPQQPDLQQAIVAAYSRDKKWVEAALAARQFVIFNPDHPQTGVFSQLASQNMERFQAQLRSKIRESALASAVTGLVGVAITGSPFASVATLQTMLALAQGESSIGNAAAKSIKQQVKLVEDAEVVDYINQLGQKLAVLAGRNEFQYEFNVILDEDLNAFALPGGKIFINAGAIAKINSEAELAGLLAHEISHAVLSHSFQMITQGTAISNLTQYLPYGNMVTGMVVTNYSRDMERQADTLGTQLLARSGYAADGLWGLMKTMQSEEKKRDRPGYMPAWMSTHPGTQERIRNLAALIQRNNYNRYSYEGVVRQGQISDRVQVLLEEAKPKSPEKKDNKKSTQTPQ